VPAPLAPLAGRGAGGRDAPWVAGAVGRLRSGDCVLNYLPGRAASALGLTSRAPLRRAPGSRRAAGRLAGCERGVAPAACRRQRAGDTHASLSREGESQQKRATFAACECAPRRQPGGDGVARKALAGGVGASGGHWSSTAPCSARGPRCSAPVPQRP
jgi:hypothetical protein